MPAVPISEKKGFYMRRVNPRVLSPPGISLSLSVGDESGRDPYSSEGKKLIFQRITMMIEYCRDSGTPSEKGWDSFQAHT